MQTDGMSEKEERGDQNEGCPSVHVHSSIMEYIMYICPIGLLDHLLFAANEEHAATLDKKKVKALQCPSIRSSSRRLSLLLSCCLSKCGHHLL